MHLFQGFGMMPSIGQVYLAEVLDVKRRDTLGSTLGVSISIGITMVYSLGALFHWKVVAWIFIGLAITMCICLVYLPESPAWLVQKGLDEDATSSLQWLRGPDYDVSEEMASLQLALYQDPEEQTTPLYREFLKPETYKPLTILISLWFFQQFSGNYAVIFYAVDVFEGINMVHKHMDEATSTSYLSAIMVGSIRILGSILGVLLLRKNMSRRLLMVWSSVGMTLAMTGLSVIEFFKSGMGHFGADAPLFLIVFLVISTSAFILFHGIGFNIVPLLLVGELCPVRLKSLTSGITITAVAIMVFIVVKIFPLAVATVGAHYTYGFFAIVCLFGGVFCYFFVPETRGKTVDELQYMYAKGNTNANNDNKE
jgi:MFS family permease